MFNICFDGTAICSIEWNCSLFFPFSCLFVHHRHPNYGKPLWGAAFYGIRSSCPQNKPTPWASERQAMFHLLFTPRDSFVRDFVLNKSSNFPQTPHTEILDKGGGGGGKVKQSKCSGISCFTSVQICSVQCFKWVNFESFWCKEGYTVHWDNKAICYLWSAASNLIININSCGSWKILLHQSPSFYPCWFDEEQYWVCVVIFISVATSGDPKYAYGEY